MNSPSLSQFLRFKNSVLHIAYGTLLTQVSLITSSSPSLLAVSCDNEGTLTSLLPSSILGFPWLSLLKLSLHWVSFSLFSGDGGACSSNDSQESLWAAGRISLSFSSRMNPMNKNVKSYQDKRDKALSW